MNIRHFYQFLIFLVGLLMLLIDIPTINKANADTTNEYFATSSRFCDTWQNITNSYGPADNVYATITNAPPRCDWKFNPTFNIPTGSTINAIKARVYNSSSGNSGILSMALYQAGIQKCTPPPFFGTSVKNGLQEYIVTPINCNTTFPTLADVNSGLLEWVFNLPTGFSTISTDAVSMQIDYTPPVITPTNTPAPTPTAIPTPSISPTPEPFLDLPFDYQSQGKSFEQVALDPYSWFDHKYPLQNMRCCVNKVLTYEGGEEKNDAYRSHSGYDYAVGIKLGTPVLASANGMASFLPERKTEGAGNMIKIDHGNGYQTWYEHLDINNLIVATEGIKVPVEKGQQIGNVGMSGNTSGPHIHLSVLKDINENGNFDDEGQYGLMDPLGWDGDYTDPWTLYGSGGAQSYKLFLPQAKPVQQSIPTSGGTLNMGKVQVTVPANAAPVFFKITSNYAGFESYEKRESIVPSIILKAFDNLNNGITQFLQNIKIAYNYSEADLQNIDEDTIKLSYFNEETKQWEPLQTTVDKNTKIATAYTSHFSKFALMGDIKDKVAPNTAFQIQGDKGQDNIYRSNVTVNLNGNDNEGGIGLQYTLYKLDDNEWVEYNDPFVIEEEGKHKFIYESIDKAFNLEEQKTLDIFIDKTAPQTSSNLSGIIGNNGWYTSDVSVNLSAQDEGGLGKTEYSLDSGSTYNLYSGPVIISTEGNTDLLYRSVDKAGNVEVAKSVKVKVDKIAPRSLVYTAGMIGKNGWFRSNVVLALNALEEGSGYDKSFYSFDGEHFAEYITPLTITTEGLTKLYYYSIDKAGNKEDKKAFDVKLDKTAPEVLIQYDIPAQDILIKGVDGLSTSVSTIALYSYTTGEVNAEDQAGNTLKLLVKDKEKGKNARLSIISLQYNGGDIITTDKNTFTVKYDFYDMTTNTVKKFDQDWKVNDQLKLSLSYSADNDSTDIKNRLADGTITTTHVLGRKFLKVISNNGILNASY